MKKKILSLALALVMCLGLAVPAFAAESKWKLEVPGKSNAEIFLGKKTFTLRDCGVYDYDPSIGETILYKEDDCQWTAENVCVLGKGDTAVFTYTYKPKESTDNQLTYGSSSYSGEDFNLTAWSDPDGDGVYDKRTIEINFSDEDDSSYGENGYADLLPENKYKALPIGSTWTGHRWSAFVSRDEEGKHEVRLSADRVLELFGPNTLVGISNSGRDTSDPAMMDWFILVEGSTQPTTPTVGGFTDVKKDNWFADPVLWAVSKDITNGTGGGKFSPAQQCTHAQILTFLYRADRGQGKAEAADMDKAVAWAREKGMIGGSFDGKAYCTRADAVSYIWQALGRENANASSFTDVPAGAAYAKAVDWAVANGVTNGTNAAQTEFSPNKVCDRGTIVTFLHRAYVPEARLK